MVPRLAITLALSGLIGCGVDPKGIEDDVPADGKYDGFYEPTDHGALAFGTTATAEIEPTHLFHAWTFSLTGPAQVGLRADPRTTNLDTVMYLYHRAAGATAWGRYIERNDDANEGSIGSALDLALEDAGEYRVLVKGYKQTLRGTFDLVSTCSGAGCPTAAECTPGLSEYAPLPAESEYSESCDAAVAAIKDSPVTATANVTIALDGHCGLGELERRSVEAWAAYYKDECSCWAEEFEAAEPEERELEVTTERHGALGTVVNVIFPWDDESGIDFTYTPDGTLLQLYLNNQSEDIRYYCR